MRGILSILIILMISAISAAVFHGISAAADKDEKWKKQLEKDYQVILKTPASRQAQLHRDLVQKWSSGGHLDDLIALYKSDLQRSPDNPILHYALGFAYAYKGEKGDLSLTSQAEAELKKSAQLQPDLSLAHYSLSGIYLRQNRFDLAVESARRCLQLDPNLTSARFILAEALRGMKQYAEAVDEYEGLLKTKPKWAEVHYGLAIIYLAQGDFISARLALSQAVSIDSKFSDAYYKLAIIDAKEGKEDEAISSYKTASKYGGHNREVLYELAQTFAESNNVAYAIEAYKKVVELDPQHAQAQLQLGNIYYQIDLKEKAVEHYNLAISADLSLKTYFISQLAQYEAGLMSPSEASLALDKALLIDSGDFLARYYYGKVESERGNVDLAISHYEAAIKLNPSHSGSYLPLLELYYDKGEISKALETYQSLIQLDPSSVDHFYLKGLSAFEAKDYPKAQLTFQKFLKLRPQAPLSQTIDARFKLAKILEGQGQLQEAIAEYESISRIDMGRIGSDPTLKATYSLSYLQMAKISRSLNDISRSMETLNRLISFEPSNYEAHYLRGKILLEMGNSPEAIQAFKESVKFKPEHFDSHYELGLLYEAASEVDSAISEYETAVGLDQSKADPFLRLGSIYLKRQDRRKAAINYEKALSLEPGHPQPQYELAIIYDEAGDKDKAIGHYALANKYDPSNYMWHFKYAKTLEGRDNAKAIEEYTTTISLNVNYALAYYHRALLARKLKAIGGVIFRNEMILEDMKQAVKLNPNWDEAYFNLGSLYLDMDQHENAKAAFDRVLAINKSFPEAQLQLGLIAEWKNDLKASVWHYEAEIKLNQKSIRAHQQLAPLYATFMMDFDKAQKEFEIALSLDKNHIPTLVNHANLLYTMNKLGSAADAYEAALQIDPVNLTANYNLALVYEYSGKKQPAIERWKRFLDLNPPAKWADEARNHLRKLGVKE